jgi:hypothetical protein
VKFDASMSWLSLLVLLVRSFSHRGVTSARDTR